MFRARTLLIIALFAVFIAGCSSLPGLRVLTGESDEQTLTDAAVQSVDLVMADKTGRTDPSLGAAADRIEAANPFVDIIEIRNDEETNQFDVMLLFSPPQVENTLEGQIQIYEALRRTFELSWQGTMRESEGADLLRVTILFPFPVSTLDSGTSYVAVVFAEGEIERGAAAAYLNGERSMVTFNDLIVQGTLNYITPQEQIFYEGIPNHPMFMLPAPTTGN
jgi:hypothetical protein